MYYTHKVEERYMPAVMCQPNKTFKNITKCIEIDRNDGFIEMHVFSTEDSQLHGICCNHEIANYIASYPILRTIVVGAYFWVPKKTDPS